MNLGRIRLINSIFCTFSLDLVMSREEANRLSSMRREEIRKNRELESNKMLRLKNILKVSWES